MTAEGVRLVRPIGQGSHSIVYFGVTADGQPCAIKVFEMAYIGHAEREMRNASGLDHPRLVTLLGPTIVEERPGLIVTFAKGKVLFQRYTQRPALTHERQAFLLTLAHVLEALGYLHDRDIVHRDIKPENIVVEPDGSAKLVDLDLSGPQLEMFQTPTRMGTAAFLSPEAVRGEPLGPESDLYGVGVLLGWGLHGALSEPGQLPQPAGDPLDPLLIAMTHPDRQQRLTNAWLAREALLELSGLPY